MQLELWLQEDPNLTAGVYLGQMYNSFVSQSKQLRMYEDLFQDLYRNFALYI